MFIVSIRIQLTIKQLLSERFKVGGKVKYIYDVSKIIFMGFRNPTLATCVALTWPWPWLAFVMHWQLIEALITQQTGSCDWQTVDYLLFQCFLSYNFTQIGQSRGEIRPCTPRQSIMLLTCWLIYWLDLFIGS